MISAVQGGKMYPKYNEEEFNLLREKKLADIKARANPPSLENAEMFVTMNRLLWGNFNDIQLPLESFTSTKRLIIDLPDKTNNPEYHRAVFFDKWKAPLTNLEVLEIKTMSKKNNSNYALWVTAMKNATKLDSFSLLTSKTEKDNGIVEESYLVAGEDKPICWKFSRPKKYPVRGTERLLEIIEKKATPRVDGKTISHFIPSSATWSLEELHDTNSAMEGMQQALFESYAGDFAHVLVSPLECSDYLSLYIMDNAKNFRDTVTLDFTQKGDTLEHWEKEQGAILNEMSGMDFALMSVSLFGTSFFVVGSDIETFSEYILGLAKKYPSRCAPTTRAQFLGPNMRSRTKMLKNPYYKEVEKGNTNCYMCYTMAAESQKPNRNPTKAGGSFAFCN